MSTFQIPQFIEQQAKIVGPLTLPQFLYIAAAGGIIFISFYVFAFFLWVLISATVTTIALALAFVKIDGEPLPRVVLSGLNYLLKPRIYTWQRVFPQKTLEVSDLEEVELLRKNMSVQEKLKSIALNITTGKIFSAPRAERPPGKSYEVVTFMTGERRLAKKVDYSAEKTEK